MTSQCQYPEIETILWNRMKPLSFKTLPMGFVPKELLGYTTDTVHGSQREIIIPCRSFKCRNNLIDHQTLALKMEQEERIHRQTCVKCESHKQQNRMGTLEVV